MARYGKAIAAVIGAAVLALYNFMNDEHVSAEEWVQVAIAVTLAIGVYLVPLTPEWPWMKTAVAAVLAVLNGFAIVVVGGLTNQELIGLLIVLLTALGVGVSNSVSDNGQPSNP